MKADKLTMSLLLDQYGALLTEKQRDCFDLYCNQDLTLAEIAELMGTSRQGIHDSISRAKAQLLKYEEVLGCLALERRDAQIAAALEAAAKELTARNTGEADQTVTAILAAARKLKEL